MTTLKWDDARTEELKNMVGSESPVTNATVNHAAEALGTSIRSVAAKLRKLGYDVASMAKEVTSKFSEEEAAALQSFVESNAGAFTYAEIAAQFLNGKFSTKQIQGKILSMELTGSVKPTEKVEAVRTYSEQEEAAFVQMVQGGKFVEEIAETLGKSVNSVRGKALSLLRSGEINEIPKQKVSHAQVKTDIFEGVNLEAMTVAELAEQLNKTPRGIRTTLTRRGIDCKDYKGSVKKEKAAANKE
jgi:transposase